ncbi:tyrosine-type recombinase/integrase [Brucella anthropi]|jgi:site-specific recombinase XerD|uniref:Site-specific recombinase XerD n=2 Tax=Hyphomicrobiales TaxID=356 RepID=A0A285V0P2_9HYPH|nr:MULTISPECIES: tyrosine-type recombinase/integrase [Hyphomicrobiales]KAB2759589.1 tyrosine-type recombinase/integrase [Brucella anthropi]KAB2773944.1 tyrosine-type recombinase/integrase [Brucella anthropi]KAB2779875.1 tyrosine-type recombinase/integrase [Brucella anthropi]RSC31319.1 integrase [Agrobacterium sp. FDAARGOS_525]SOC47487.1 site-specific recombinase XerD [Rhizobium subbaraonis]
MTPLAPDLSAFLRTHLPGDCGASRHTIAAYAHAFTLLLRFAAGRLKRTPSELAIEDLDVQMIRAFLEHIEEGRANSVRSRNARLAAVKSFFRFVEHRHPACLEQAMMIRAMPIKRTDAKLIDYLTREEVRALLAAPNRHTPGGLRDGAMLHLAYAAGLRASELLAVRMDDFPEVSLSSVRILGKGRRERVLPLWKETQATIRAWLAVRPGNVGPELFLNRDGRQMTRDGFAYRLRQHVATAEGLAPSIAAKHVTPHVLRHSCAMHTLQATGDIRKVALWLGHTSIQTTEMYLRADPAEKLALLDAHHAPLIKPGKFREPSDKLMQILAVATQRS